MPLIKSKSKKAISKNIEKIIHEYKNSHKIGNSKPSNLKTAMAQAAAIAYAQKNK